MKIDTKLIEVEEGMAIVIPSHILKRLNIDKHSKLCVELKGDSIVVCPSCRSGWDEAAMLCHHKGDDDLVIDEFFEEDTKEEWIQKK